MRAPVPHRPTTPDEAIAIKLLGGVRFPTACWDKYFTRNMSSADQITEGQVPQLWRLLRRYRRQWRHPERERLLQLADQLAAPDLRKLAQRRMEQSRIESMRSTAPEQANVTPGLGL